MSDKEILNKTKWSQEEFEENLSRVNDLLLTERSHRIRPGLDDKCLTSWNAMMLKGLCEAYTVFKEDLYLRLALKNAKWLENNQLREDGGLWRNYKKGTSNIEGFLEDYAHVIDAFMAMYSVSFDESWLIKAKKLMDY